MVAFLLVVAACVAAVVVLRSLAVLADRRMNPVSERPPYLVKEDARRLHETLFVADLHADTLLWNRDLLVESQRGHVDLPRLMRGRVALQTFTVVTKVPGLRPLEPTRRDRRVNPVTALAVAQGWPWETWVSLKARALWQARKLHNAAARSEGRLVVVQNKADLRSFLARRDGEPSLVAGWLGLEGAHALEGALASVDELFAAGFRLIGLVHLDDNEVAGSAHGPTNSGLTEFGREVVARMEELGIVVDLAHASPRTIDDVLDIATRPVLVSHTGFRGVCDNERNVSDEHARRVASTGGLIGVGYWPGATGGDNAAAIARSARYGAKLVGVEHLALGSDFDGTVRTPFDTSGLAKITEALLAEGFCDEEIRRICGGNVVRLLLELFPD